MRRLWLILLFPALVWASPRLYVHGPGDLEAHFRLHIQRVRRLGLALFDAHPEEFPGISRSDVVSFLNLHDRAKFNRIPALYSIYGLGYHPDSPELQEKIAELVENLNEADGRIREAYFRDVNPQGARSLSRIERVADVVDRNTDPVAREEFAMVPGQEPPLSAYLSDPRDLALARELKGRYGSLVSDLAFRRCPFAAFRL